MTTARLRTWDGIHYLHAQGGGGGAVDATAAKAFRITTSPGETAHANLVVRWP